MRIGIHILFISMIQFSVSIKDKDEYFFMLEKYISFWK